MRNVFSGNGVGVPPGDFHDYDIMIGDSGGVSADTTNVVCANNSVVKLVIRKCKDVIVTGNNVKVKLQDDGTALNAKGVNNMVAGVWTP